MATGFGDWSTSTKAHSVLKQIAQNEVERMRPAPRLAEVASINQDDKSLMVKFVGESNEVKVPYTSVAPANSGQWVRIGGTTHDRYVEDVIGTTDTEARLEATESHVNSLMSSILGDEWANEDDGESGGFIEKITDFFGGLGGGGAEVQELIQALADNPLGTLEQAKQKIGGLIEGAFGLINPSRIPLLPASHIGKDEPNILANYTFDDAFTLEESPDWEHDAAEGRTKPGSAKTTANGNRKTLTSVEILSDSGQSITVEAYVKWSGVAATGNAFQIALESTDASDVTTESVIQSISSPAASGGWSKLTGAFILPEGVKAVRLRFIVTSTVTAGDIWFDDASVRKTNNIKQGLISNLIPDLGGLWTNFSNVFQFITGVPGASLTTLQTWIGQLKNILSGISVPGGNLLPTLSQAINGSISNVQNFSQNVVDAILGGIGRVPVVGGSILDIINSLTGFADKTENDHQGLIDNIFAGATSGMSDPAAPFKTDEEVRQAVAALKSRSESYQQAKEMEYLSATPLWQGLIPGGDVTVPISMVNTTMTAYGMSHNGYAGSIVMTLFRARSAFPIEKLSFAASTNEYSTPSVWNWARVLLATYREDTNMWEVVARTQDFRNELGVDNSWVHTSLETPYVPAVGEDMALVFTGSSSVDNAPVYDILAATPNPISSTYMGIPRSSMHPRGTTAILSSKPGGIALDDIGDSFSSDDPEMLWYPNSYIFVHFSPDLGQSITLPPRYWFDDFNTGLGTYDYSLNSTTGTNARSDRGMIEFNGTTNAKQSVICTVAMNTEDIRVQADAYFDSNNSGGSTYSTLVLNCSTYGQGGVSVRIQNNSVKFVRNLNLLYPDPSPAVIGEVNTTQQGANRITIEFNSTTKNYTAKIGSTVIGTLNDSANTVPRDKTRRYAGFSVSRASFLNSPAWDNFLIQDVT